MLTIGSLGVDAAGYYVEEVAAGRDDYYTADPAGPGRWMGHGADRLGLSGPVGAVEFGRVLARRDPHSDALLVGSFGKTAGFDATFCAPKSVSLLDGLGDDDTQNIVRTAHAEAVDAAFAVLEPEAAWARRGHAGVIRVRADGLVAAGFTHHTSRLGDPHLHTHVVIANVVFVPADGRWSALDGRPLHRWAKPVGHLYQAHLRYALARDLGVEWGPVVNGHADIIGIPDTVLREFSRRRQDIEAWLDDHDATGPKAAQAATYATRPDKNREADLEEIQHWVERAEAAGLDVDHLADLITSRDRKGRPPLVEWDPDDLFDWLASETGVTEHASTFGRADLLVAIADAHPDGAPVPVIVDLADRFLQTQQVVELDPIAHGARAGEHRYTVQSLLDIEHDLLALAVDGLDTHTAVAPVDDELLVGLDTDQQQMVTRLCEGGHRIDVVVGLAGSGKTTALAAARQAWEDVGLNVRGCALAARAAAQLDETAGIPSTTLHRVLRNLDSLDERTVLVVDEAAMVGTRDLHRLAQACADRGAKLVLVGDPHQLSEIDAGGAHRALADLLEASTLTTNRRQQQPWERTALHDLRHGNVRQAVAAYQRHERILIDDHPARALIDDWLKTEETRPTILASRRADIDRLNTGARHALQATGQLGPDQVVLGGRGFAEGDRVIALRNNHPAKLWNGTTGTLATIDQQTRTLTIRPDRGSAITLPFAYADAGWLDHGYAITIHKAQGATLDRALVLADDTWTRQTAYTALSRARHGTRIYLAADHHLDDPRHGPKQETDPVETLTANVSRDRPQKLACSQGGLSNAADARLRAALADVLDGSGAAPPSRLPQVARRLEQSRDRVTAIDLGIGR